MTIKRTGSLQHLWLGPALGAIFLLACCAHGMHEVRYALASNKVSAALKFQHDWGSLVPLRVLGFALAMLAIHLLLGLVAALLTRATEVAIPRHMTGKRRQLILLWFMLLAATVLTLNTALFPASALAATDSWMAIKWSGWPIGYWLAGLVAGLASAVCIAALLKLPHRRSAIAAMPVAALGVVLAWPITFINERAQTMTGPAPNIIIIGIDSLRDDLVDNGSRPAHTPNIDAFLSGAHRFTDTVSPLARTYGAWVSILTGRHPVSSNARFNLMPRSMVHPGETLGNALRRHGYHSVYATDEVRFANFDHSFGFDQLIMPPIGASDFLLGKIGDQPLANLLAGTRAGSWFFPSNHANRAAYVTYRPEHFVARLERELEAIGPVFAAIHLTLAHWPYSWAGNTMPTTPPQFRSAYLQSVEAVDRQFADVIAVLERKGVLDNAYVVVLSDHGEAMGWPSDTMLRKTGTGMEIWDSMWGHGTSVMSPHQYSVLFAVRGFGGAALMTSPARHDVAVSLEDVRPTLEELATGQASERIDGLSLVPILRGTGMPDGLATRVRFTETCFNTPRMMAGKFNESGLVNEAAAYYEMVPETGWLQLRPNRLPELMARKQRAALSREALLAAIPSWEDGSVTYLFTDRRAPLPRRLDGRPDPAVQPEAARLWDALHERFTGELPLPPEPPHM